MFDVILVLVSRYLKYDTIRDVIWEEECLSDVILIQRFKLFCDVIHNAVWEEKYWYNFYQF